MARCGTWPALSSNRPMRWSAQRERLAGPGSAIPTARGDRTWGRLRYPDAFLHPPHHDRRVRRALPRAARAAGRGTKMKLSRGVARFNKRSPTAFRACTRGSSHRGPSSSTAVDVRVASTERRSSRSARPDSGHRAPVRRGVRLASELARGRWSRDPCGAHLRRRAAPKSSRRALRGRRSRACRARSARTAGSRRNSRFSSPRRAAARLWAPRPRQRAQERIRVPQPQTACAGGARRRGPRTARRRSGCHPGSGRVGAVRRVPRWTTRRAPAAAARITA